MPNEPQLAATRAAVLELAGKTPEANIVLDDAQHRWPEAPSIWAARGIILAAHNNPVAAHKALDTAITLGAQSPEVHNANGVDAKKLFLTRPPRDW